MIPYLAILNINVRDIEKVCEALELSQKEIHELKIRVSKECIPVINLIWIEKYWFRGYIKVESYNMTTNTMNQVKKTFRIKNLDKTLKQISTVKEDFPEIFL